MTLFELDALDDKDQDINDLLEEEMVRIVGGAVGLNFTNKGWPFGWVAGDKKLNFSIKYGNYKSMDEKHGKRYISCGYDYHNKGCIGGAGSPCDSIDEAIRFFKRGIEKWS